MIYTDKVREACEIMQGAHFYDRDKGGYPYVMHPLHLAEQCDTEDETIVALLHDVVEDHGEIYSFEYLEKYGFGDEVVNALRVLTHKKGVPYEDYIAEVSENDLATSVKMKDLLHNLDRTRCEISPCLVRRYTDAYEYLSNALMWKKLNAMKS